MQPKIRILGFDLDDTALNKQKELTPRVKQAIEKALDAGIIVLPATGRALAGIPNEIMAIQGLAYALTSNGAKVFSLQNKKAIFTDCFTLEQAEQLWKLVNQFTCSPAMYIDGDAYTETRHFAKLAPHVSSHVLEYLNNSRTIVPDILETMWKKGAPVEKITVYFDDLEERKKAWATINALGNTCITSSVAANMEINTATANKGVSLLALADYLNIPHSQVMAVGDNSNDVEMIQMVGYGVAMGNATPEVKQVANSVTATCDEDGLALAIEAILPNI